MSVTEEVRAGACDLDGEALTLALLHENERLIATNKKLNRDHVYSMVAVWIMLLLMPLVAVLF